MGFMLTKDPEFGSLTLPSSLLTFLKFEGACGRIVLLDRIVYICMRGSRFAVS
jgi:hypothetical protein